MIKTETYTKKNKTSGQPLSAFLTYPKLRESQQALGEVTYALIWDSVYLREKLFLHDVLEDNEYPEMAKASAEAAIDFISKIGQRANLMNVILKYPTIHPSDDGSIDVFWNGNPSLLVNFSTKIGTYGFFGNSTVKGTQKGISPIGVIRYELLEWLTGNAK